jgi:hypothetical protein
MFDFSGADTALTFRNINLIGNNNSVPSDATTGTAIKLAKGTLSRFENVVIQFFNIGLHFTGFGYYSKHTNVNLLSNYTNGLLAENASFNGASFSNSQFSNTVNGTGAKVDAGSVNITFRNSWFEVNAGVGLELEDFGNAICDVCYFEANDNYDLYAHNGFPHNQGILRLTGSYFDRDLDKSHYRIRLQNAYLNAQDNEIHGTGDGNPPVQVAPVTAGTHAGIAINNIYDTATFASSEEGWLIQDSKHPRVGRLSTIGGPTNMRDLVIGDTFRNTDAATAVLTPGYIVTASGKGSGVSDPAATATTTATDATIVPSSTQHELSPGEWIGIAGVDFGVGADTYAQVLWTASGPSVELDKVANQSVAGAAITYKPGAFRPLGGVYTDMASYVCTQATLEDIWTYSVPANVLGTNGILTIELMGTKAGADAGNSTITVGVGGSYYTINAAANDTNTWYGRITVANIDATNVQRISYVGHNGPTTVVGYAADTIDSTAAIGLQTRVTCAGYPTDTITQTMAILSVK